MITRKIILGMFIKLNMQAISPPCLQIPLKYFQMYKNLNFIEIPNIFSKHIQTLIQCSSEQITQACTPDTIILNKNSDRYNSFTKIKKELYDLFCITDEQNDLFAIRLQKNIYLKHRPKRGEYDYIFKDATNEQVEFTCGLYNCKYIADNICVAIELPCGEIPYKEIYDEFSESQIKSIDDENSEISKKVYNQRMIIIAQPNNSSIGIDAIAKTEVNGVSKIQDIYLKLIDSSETSSRGKIILSMPKFHIKEKNVCKNDHIQTIALQCGVSNESFNTLRPKSNVYSTFDINYLGDGFYRCESIETQLTCDNVLQSNKSSPLIKPKPPYDLKIDKPFVVIYIDENNQILFASKIKKENLFIR